MLYKGQTITVKTAQGNVSYRGTVHHISRTGKVVSLMREHSMGIEPIRFYRDDRQGSDRKTYIDNPGSGTFGHSLNDRFVEPKQTTKTVQNLMTGKEIQIPSDTPLCCDPSSETYWSM